MDSILGAVEGRQNVIITNLGGVERSRLLLRSEFALLSKAKPASLNKIYHIVTWDANVTKTYNEANILPFGELDFKLARLYGSDTDENKSDSPDVLQEAHIIICPIKFVLDEEINKKLNLSRTDALIVFDGVPLDSIESSCCELAESRLKSGESIRANLVFSPLAREAHSIILACNRPIDGLEQELGCKFPIVIDRGLGVAKTKYRVFSSIIAEGPTPKSIPDGLEGWDELDDGICEIVEKSVSKIQTGGIVIFLPSYGQMIAFHSKWQKSGLFQRLGIPYARENRGPGQLKKMLINFSKCEQKSLIMVSHRFHQDIHLADCVLSSSTRLVISIGLPYPFSSDTWTARIKHNNELCLATSGLLNGKDLLKYRAIEYMNGVIRKCIDEMRYQDCAFLILDRSVANERDKFCHEMGDVQVESSNECLSRFERWCQI